jgi:pimeloyl-ACP methyl ester carboxylesterase
MTQFVDVPCGRIAFEEAGTGSPVVLVPGMGDLRSSYRFAAPRLVAAGYRVASMDIRGHGESGAAWDDFSVGAVGRDILALVTALGDGPAHVVGNSMAAGAAVVAAALEPEKIRSVVLVDPFVRDMMPGWAARLLFGTVLRRPWGPALWRVFYRKEFASQLPPDFDVEAERVHANLAQRGRFEALRKMATASKIESERSTAAVRAPALVVMGSKDPDFPKPEVEAQRVATMVRGSVRMIDGAGHYPQTEMPDAFVNALMPFFAAADAPHDLVAHGS